VEIVDPVELAKNDEQAASELRIFPMRRPFFFYPQDKAPPALETRRPCRPSASSFTASTCGQTNKS
jgi:hypothetical protein